MKKIIPVLIVVLLTLSACNFPQEDLSKDPVVQTRVAELLTQGAPSDPSNKPTPKAETPEVPEGSQSEEKSTETVPVESAQPPATEPAPTEPAPTEAAPTEVPVTQEPATEEPTAETPTQAGDPWSGTPDFIEEFNQGSYWNFDGDQLLSKVADGKLEFTSKGTPWWSSWYTTSPAQKNGYFETTFDQPNCAGADRFGLVIRWGASNEFYYLGVTCDGNWGFSYYTKNNQTLDIIAYAPSDALNPHSETNRIGILANDNNFDFYVNGELVGSATHDALNEEGNFGFLTMSTGTQNFQTMIDKLEYWKK
jgi:hypothetical protein